MVILAGSAAHKKLVEIVTRPRLIAAIRKLSSFHQTSGLEAKHALDNLQEYLLPIPFLDSSVSKIFCSCIHKNIIHKECI